MVKTICAVLVFALCTSSTVVAQGPVIPADQSPKTWILRSISSFNDRRGLSGRERLWPAAANVRVATSDAQQPAERSWAGRHPVAMGAMIGAAAGALVGASPCWKEVCGDGHGPLLVAFGAGLGASIGAGVGFTVSLARH